MNIICPSDVRLSKAAILGNFPLPLSYLTDVMKNDSLSQETKKKNSTPEGTKNRGSKEMKGERNEISREWCNLCEVLSLITGH